jgi:transglutaminase-like putative cysteine protease
VSAALPAAIDRTRDRRQVAWAALAVVFGGAPHLFSVVPWVPLVVLGSALWRIAAAARGWRLPSLWIRVPVTVAAFAGVLVSYRSVSGVEAGSALLLVMAGMKLLETRDERDRILVVLIAYFLLFAVFLREQAIWSIAWLACGAVGITAALAQTVRREGLLPVQGSFAVAGRMVAQALPLAAVLFLLFPRIPGPFWAIPNAKLSGMSGLSEEVSPGDITELGLSDEVAFRVRFDGDVPPAGSLYWRGPVLERFDGRAWTALAVNRRTAEAPASGASGREYGYQVVLEPQGKRWLLALETPVRWSAPRAALGPGLQLLSAEPVWDRLSYRARSAIGETGATSATEQSLDFNRRLPTGRNPQAVALARELRAAAPDDRAFFAAVLAHFRDEGFRYSLSPPPLGPDPVDEFLFGTREGFCEHFASAFAVLARAGGVPARLVVGYQGGEPNPFGDYWIVRQANAHAWVEAWVDGAWRRIDPTATVAPERIERGFEESLADAPQVADRLWRANALVNGVVLSWDAANAAWDRWVLAFGPEAQDDLLLALGFEVPKTIQLAMLAAAGSVACLVVMGLTIRGRRTRARDPGARAYAELCRRLAPVVRPRGLAEAPSRYADAVAAARPDLAADVRVMTDMYLRLRYAGPHGPDLARRLARRVSRFRPAAARAR